MRLLTLLAAIGAALTLGACAGTYVAGDAGPHHSTTSDARP